MLFEEGGGGGWAAGSTPFFIHTACMFCLSEICPVCDMHEKGSSVFIYLQLVSFAFHNGNLLEIT